MFESKKNDWFDQKIEYKGFLNKYEIRFYRIIEITKVLLFCEQEYKYQNMERSKLMQDY